MDKRYYSFIFVGVIVAITLFANGSYGETSVSQDVDDYDFNAGKLSPYSASLGETIYETNIRRVPARNWDVLDPSVSAEAVLIRSLDEPFPFYHYNTYTMWPTASLTKFLTAVTVLENIGVREKVTITERASLIGGSKIGLRDGEIYAVEDLLKIMILASSNDASVAFEDYFGKDEFVRIINAKAYEIGMERSVFHDGSGLSDVNVSTANDLFRLVQYILEKHPILFQWTRSPSVLVQPINSEESRVVYNINPLSSRGDFLGGKTGTSSVAKENLITLISHNEQRIAIIILGSWNRVRAMNDLLEWIDEAYDL